LVKMKRNHIRLTGPDKYGHWWFEIGDHVDPGSESYGWWPEQRFDGHPLADLFRTLTSVPGALNGEPGFWPPGEATRDPHHGDLAEEEFHPLVRNADTRTDEEIADCLRTFARGFAAARVRRWRWTFGAGPNCQTFQEDAMRHCGLWHPDRVP
jgi:hypothetical protein